MPAILIKWFLKSQVYMKEALMLMTQLFQWKSVSRTTDTQWRHKSKISEKLGQCGRQNMLWPYLKIWEWEWIFGRAVKAISCLGVSSPWSVWLYYIALTIVFILSKSMRSFYSKTTLNVTRGPQTQILRIIKAYYLIKEAQCPRTVFPIIL